MFQCRLVEHTTTFRIAYFGHAPGSTMRYAWVSQGMYQDANPQSRGVGIRRAFLGV